MGVALLLCVALVSDARMLLGEIRGGYYARVVEDVGKVDARFGYMHPFLPERGEVGFLTDWGETLSVAVDGTESYCPPVLSRVPSRWESRAFGRYFQTQYALAPLLVRCGTDYPHVIGNFSNRRAAARRQFVRGLTRVRDFGDGIVLYRRWSR